MAEGQRMPTLFVGHGSPGNVIEDNRWTRGFRALRKRSPRPKAVLCVSAHWYVQGTYVTGQAQPRTIHDFFGFPKQMYDLRYPAPGHPEVARRVCELIGEERAQLDSSWGFDHGTWSVLMMMYAGANIPVIQLSIDAALSPGEHMAIGEALRPLRDEGVLIMGSGNITHNLRFAMQQMQMGEESVPTWARAVDEGVVEATQARDTDRLLAIWPDSEDGRMAHPSPDHWLPLLYVYGAADHNDRVSFPIEGFVASLSMRSVVFGGLEPG